MNGESYAYTIEYPTATNDVIPGTVRTSTGATISLSPALRGDERVVVLVTGVKNGFRDIIGEFTFNDAGRSTIVLTPSQIATFATNADDLYCIVERQRSQSLGDTFPAGGSLTILYKRAERTWTVTE